tara:strand:- start:1871 stop:2902 length:1032 start_codon:yes stop_codon:yes gene_type:complete
MTDSREWTAARDEYTYQLVQSIMPPILEIFENIYNKAKDSASEKEDYALVLFQLELQKIPHWNNISIERECKKIISGYPSLMDHVAAVFVSNIQILSCVRLDTENKKDIHIKIPTRDSFIHKVLIQCAENIFQDPLLFWHEISYGEKRENTKKKQSLIDESIKEAIREMLPIQDILKEYLAETGKNNSQKDTPDKDDDNDSVASKESEDIDSDSSSNTNFDNRLSKNAFDNEDDSDDDDEVKHISFDNKNNDSSPESPAPQGLPPGASNFGPVPPQQPPQQNSENFNSHAPQYAPGSPQQPTNGTNVNEPVYTPPPSPTPAAPEESANAGWQGDSDDSDDSDE